MNYFQNPYQKDHDLIHFFPFILEDVGSLDSAQSVGQIWQSEWTPLSGVPTDQIESAGDATF
ncbi:MAG: hypothetical protein GY816_24355 [Cytophagales bacterium]|nr:hypothetical protein [Cytophagales bacterium]